MTESQILLSIFGVVLMSIQLALAYFLKKHFDKVDELTIMVVKIQGSLDVGNEKFDRLKDEIESHENRIYALELKSQSHEGRIGTIEQKCKFAHPNFPATT